MKAGKVNIFLKPFLKKSINMISVRKPLQLITNVFTTTLIILLNVTFFVVLVNPTISCREFVLKCALFY
jgi:hypothetical protein